MPGVGGGGGGGYFLIRGEWGGAAEWGRVFTTGFTIFNRVTRMGSYIFVYLGGETVLHII